MTVLAMPVYLDHLRTESARFRAVILGCDPTIPVPSCPAWTTDDLVWHLGEVQDFWARVIQQRPEGPDDSWQDPARPEDRAGLLDFFDAAHQRLTDALEAADPAATAWSWSTEQTVGFTYRRQAHEALIHRLDAELAAGAETPMDPRLAADGVTEVLDIMFGGQPSWGGWTPLDHYVRVDCIDTDDSVWTRLGVFSGTEPDGTEHPGEEDIHVVPDPGIEPDVVLSGRAGDLDAWLWRRRDDHGIAVAGDHGVYDRFRRAVDHPVN